MPPKKGRGKAVNLAEFVGNAGGSDLRWAEDQWAETPPSGPAEAGDRPPAMDGEGKPHWRNHGYKVGNMGGNFREEAPVAISSVVPDDMKPPFVAYVGNLPHNIPADTVSESFNEVLDARVIKNDKSTFAYVEFETRDALQAAIFMTGKIVGGRKIKVDIASQQQRDRLEAERNGGGMRRSPSGDFGGRDSMGAAQPVMAGAGGFGSGRRGMGSRNPSTNDFTRDSMGSAQPVGTTPTTGGSPMPADFSRDAFGESKPRTPTSGGAPRFRASKPSSPVARGDFGSWRESSTVSQPDKPADPATAAPTSPAATGAPKFAARKTPDEKKDAPSSGWRDAPKKDQSEAGGWRDAPKKDQPKEEAGSTWRDAPPAAAAKPKEENSWRRGPPPAS